MRVRKEGIGWYKLAVSKVVTNNSYSLKMSKKIDQWDYTLIYRTLYYPKKIIHTPIHTTHTQYYSYV